MASEPSLASFVTASRAVPRMRLLSKVASLRGRPWGKGELALYRPGQGMAQPLHASCPFFRCVPAARPSLTAQAVEQVGARGEFGQTGVQDFTGMRLPLNQLVDTDAQGRPAAARRPLRGRRSHARYTVQVV